MMPLKYSLLKSAARSSARYSSTVNRRCRSCATAMGPASLPSCLISSYTLLVHHITMRKRTPSPGEEFWEGGELAWNTESVSRSEARELFFCGVLYIDLRQT